MRLKAHFLTASEAGTTAVVERGRAAAAACTALGARRSTARSDDMVMGMASDEFEMFEKKSAAKWRCGKGSWRLGRIETS